jgi:hypothetical protein
MPVGPDLNNVKVMNASVAELVKCCGFYLPMPSSATARDEEIALERQFLDHNLVVYESRREIDTRSPWCFTLRDALLAEDKLHSSTEVGAATKMHLARRLQLRDGGDLAACFRSYTNMSKARVCGVVATGCS